MPFCPLEICSDFFMKYAMFPLKYAVLFYLKSEICSILPLGKCHVSLLKMQHWYMQSCPDEICCILSPLKYQVLHPEIFSVLLLKYAALSPLKYQVLPSWNIQCSPPEICSIVPPEISSVSPLKYSAFPSWNMQHCSPLKYEVVIHWKYAVLSS